MKLPEQHTEVSQLPFCFSSLESSPSVHVIVQDQTLVLPFTSAV
jgi:hypothetical protein